MSAERWAGLAERAAAKGAKLEKIGEPFHYKLSDRNGYWVSSPIAGTEEHALGVFEGLIKLLESSGALT